MHEETLYKKTREVLKEIQGEEILDQFYLAGGTGLALQLGHRKSIDLDFFSRNYPGNELIVQAFKKYKPRIVNQVKGTADMLISGIKVSFLEYNYSLIDDLIEYEDIEVASILDIACMKLTAISSRGSKKDFIDMYRILQDYDFNVVLDKFRSKYESVNYSLLHLKKSLVYFIDAESDPDPDIIDNIKWEEVKKFLKMMTIGF